jgi:hypothetical protein
MKLAWPGFLSKRVVCAAISVMAVSPLRAQSLHANR